ncbi:MAG TPA: hypothetical protein VFD07_00955 [Candidatus Krumholzibacteria bacterium]|nr:hypothetical protein [Candidatus Krumholzibacteria bacterium]
MPIDACVGSTHDHFLSGDVLEFGPAEPLENAVPLRVLRLRWMLDVVERQVQLTLVTVDVAAVFRAAVGQDPHQGNPYDEHPPDAPVLGNTVDSGNR